MAELKALCMSCRIPKMNDDGTPKTNDKGDPVMGASTQVMKNPQVGRMKDKKTGEETNRYSAQGECAQCGGKMFKFMSKTDAEAMM